MSCFVHLGVFSIVWNPFWHTICIDCGNAFGFLHIICGIEWIFIFYTNCILCTELLNEQLFFSAPGQRINDKWPNQFSMMFDFFPFWLSKNGVCVFFIHFRSISINFCLRCSIKIESRNFFLFAARMNWIAFDWERERISPVLLTANCVYELKIKEKNLIRIKFKLDKINLSLCKEG